MKTRLGTSFSLVMGLLMGCGSVFAHHGTNASYDTSQTVTVKGTVVEFVMRNPHGQLWIDAKDDKGTVVRWGFELHSILLMRRAGWTRETLKAGDEVTVTANPSRAGTPIGVMQTVTLANGKEYFRDIPQTAQR